MFPKFTAAQGFAAGLMNFVFDPDYARNGVFYTLHMENLTAPGESAAAEDRRGARAEPGGLHDHTGAADADRSQSAMVAREMVIVEWTDRQIGNTTFEGTAREVLRMQLPGLFHPLNEITFNPAARPGDPDWRVMYLGVGDSGTGERPGPMRLHAQRLDTLHGKILRIIPMLSEHASTSTVSENGRYRIPNDNPFVSVEGARKEIWALGLRNPHRLTWYVDPARPREAVIARLQYRPRQLGDRDDHQEGRELRLSAARGHAEHVSDQRDGAAAGGRHDSRAGLGHGDAWHREAHLCCCRVSPRAAAVATRLPTASSIEGNEFQPCKERWCSVTSRRAVSGTPR